MRTRAPRARPDLPHYPFEVPPKPPLQLGIRVEKGVAIVYPRGADGELDLEQCVARRWRGLRSRLYVLSPQP